MLLSIGFMFAFFCREETQQGLKTKNQRVTRKEMTDRP
jgi:hypothetical protein